MDEKFMERLIDLMDEIAAELGKLTIVVEEATAIERAEVHRILAEREDKRG